MRKILLLLLILTVFGTFLLSACDSQGYNDTVPPTDDTAPGEETAPPEEPAKNSIYIVGDSLSCEYKGKNLEAFYPRVGFGSQLKNYTHEKLIVNNLALSGRSSKSFISELDTLMQMTDDSEIKAVTQRLILDERHIIGLLEELIM